MKKTFSQLITIFVFIYGSISMGKDFKFISVKKINDFGPSFTKLKDGEISNLTYITDGVVQEGGDTEYQLQDNTYLPVEERKNQKTLKSVRVVHGEYGFWVTNKKTSKETYQDFLSKYNNSNFIQALIPFYENSQNGSIIQTKVYFPCEIARTFEGVKSLPESDIALSSENAANFIKEKVDTYFTNFILDQKKIEFDQIVGFNQPVAINNQSLNKNFEQSRLIHLGSVTQTLFHFNQIARWGQIDFNFFSNPRNPNQTFIFINSRLAMRSDFMSIGPDKREGRVGSIMDVFLKSPLENYMMGSSSFFKKSTDGQILEYFDKHRSIGDLVDAIDTLVSVKNFSPTNECQASSGPSILSGIPKFQQVYVEGFAKLVSEF